MFSKTLLALTCVLLFNTAIGQTFAIIADRLIDGSNNQAKNNPTIIVSRGKIIEVNFTGIKPDSAIVINLKGYTLLPGLMDVHTHLLADGGDYEKDLYGRSASFRSLRAVKYLSIALNNGFTTLRDVCSEGTGFSDVDLSHAIDSDYFDGPRIIPSGKGIAATGMYEPWPATQNWELSLPHGTQFASGRDECLKAVREQVSSGVRWIKLYADWNRPTFNLDEMKIIVDEARKFHVNVAAHATSKEGIKWLYRPGYGPLSMAMHLTIR